MVRFAVTHSSKRVFVTDDWSKCADKSPSCFFIIEFTCTCADTLFRDSVLNSKLWGSFSQKRSLQNTCLISLVHFQTSAYDRVVNWHRKLNNSLRLLIPEVCVPRRRNCNIESIPPWKVMFSVLSDACLWTSLTGRSPVRHRWWKINDYARDN